MKIVKKNNGFTLLELIALIVVLSIVGITMGGTFLHMIRISADSYLIKKATITAYNYIEDFHAYKANNPPDTWEDYLNNHFNGTETDGDFTIDLSWSVTTETVEGYYEDVDVYRYVVTVSHPNLANDITIQNAYTERQL